MVIPAQIKVWRLNSYGRTQFFRKSDLEGKKSVGKLKRFHVEYMAVTTSASKNYYVPITFR